MLQDFTAGITKIIQALTPDPDFPRRTFEADQTNGTGKYYYIAEKVNGGESFEIFKITLSPLTYWSTENDSRDLHGTYENRKDCLAEMDRLEQDMIEQLPELDRIFHGSEVVQYTKTGALVPEGGKEQWMYYEIRKNEREGKHYIFECTVMDFLASPSSHTHVLKETFTTEEDAKDAFRKYQEIMTNAPSVPHIACF